MLARRGSCGRRRSRGATVCASIQSQFEAHRGAAGRVPDARWIGSSGGEERPDRAESRAWRPTLGGSGGASPANFTSSSGANRDFHLALRSRLAVQEQKGCCGDKGEKVGKDKEKKKAPPVPIVTVFKIARDRYASWLMFRPPLKEEKGRTPRTVCRRLFLASWSPRERKEYMAILMRTAHSGCWFRSIYSVSRRGIAGYRDSKKKGSGCFCGC